MLKFNDKSHKFNSELSTLNSELLTVITFCSNKKPLLRTAFFVLICLFVVFFPPFGVGGGIVCLKSRNAVGSELFPPLLVVAEI